MLALLGLLIIAPFVLMLLGIGQFFVKDESKRKKGRNLILTGIALLGTEILIGYSICSNIHIGGMH